MMGSEKPRSGAERVAKRRAALRAQGLRPRTYWVPDTSTEEFRRQAASDVAWLWRNYGQSEYAIKFAEAMAEDILKDEPIPRWREDD